MPDIRTQVEINTIINRAQQSLAVLGLEIIQEESQGIDEENTLHKDKVYRLILLDVYLFNLLDPLGNILNFYLASANSEKFNKILTGLQNLI